MSDNGFMLSSIRTGTQHTKHPLTVFALGLLLAGSAALGAPETASTAAPAHVPSHSHQSDRGCDEVWGDGGCDT
ncbi:hypothetical protein GCM10010345_29620 [Streptomyces canarius]|uniref:Uncharacterized protein n=1 Tax=Streptomyces canarius TaxID=285453 RepID=A0ABQ3CPH9_9ACTN|nr:hypothetical protein GCM10010345_29620 [Streptomyces canarius]